MTGQTTVYDYLDDDECAWDQLSVAWAVLTLGYIGPDTASLSKWSPTHTDVPSWLATGRTFPGMTTYAPSTAPNGLGGSTFSRVASPAKTSPKPDDASGSSAETDPPCSSNSPGSQAELLSREASFWSKTCPVYSLPTVAEISESFSQRWPKSGFTTLRGECWTVATSECPNGGGESSSLGDVVAGEVAPRFFLSPKAAAGILRRAEKRGRSLPDDLRTRLTAVAEEPTTTKLAGAISLRRLTPTEFERLQGLPDGWTIP